MTIQGSEAEGDASARLRRGWEARLGPTEEASRWWQNASARMPLFLSSQHHNPHAGRDALESPLQGLVAEVIPHQENEWPGEIERKTRFAGPGRSGGKPMEDGGDRGRRMGAQQIVFARVKIIGYGAAHRDHAVHRSHRGLHAQVALVFVELVAPQRDEIVHGHHHARGHGVENAHVKKRENLHRHEGQIERTGAGFGYGQHLPKAADKPKNASFFAVARRNTSCRRESDGWISRRTSMTYPAVPLYAAGRWERSMSILFARVAAAEHVGEALHGGQSIAVAPDSGQAFGVPRVQRLRVAPLQGVAFGGADPQRQIRVRARVVEDQDAMARADMLLARGDASLEMRPPAADRGDDGDGTCCHGDADGRQCTVGPIAIPASSSAVELSVVIPTRRRADILRRCLDALALQTAASRLEAVVVSDGEDADTAALFATHAWGFPLRFLSLPKSHQGTARNRGVALARGEVCLFIGDDIFLAPNACEIHLRAHHESRMPNANLAVLGFTTWNPTLEITPVMRWLEESGWQFGYPMIGRYAGAALPTGVQHRFTYTSHLSLPTALARAHPFREDVSLYGWEDIEWGTRLRDAGVRLLYRDDAVGFHHHSLTLDQSLLRMETLGASAVRLARLVPSLDRLPRGPKRLAYRCLALLPTLRGRHAQAFLRGIEREEGQG